MNTPDEDPVHLSSHSADNHASNGLRIGWYDFGLAPQVESPRSYVMGCGKVDVNVFSLLWISGLGA